MVFFFKKFFSYRFAVDDTTGDIIIAGYFDNMGILKYDREGNQICQSLNNMSRTYGTAYDPVTNVIFAAAWPGGSQSKLFAIDNASCEILKEFGSGWSKNPTIGPDGALYNTNYRPSFQNTPKAERWDPSTYTLLNSVVLTSKGNNYPTSVLFLNHIESADLISKKCWSCYLPDHAWPGHLEQSFATEEEAKTMCELMISQGKQCDGITHHFVFGDNAYGIWKQSGYAGGIGVYNTPKGYSSKVYNSDECEKDHSDCPGVYQSANDDCTHNSHCPENSNCINNQCEKCWGCYLPDHAWPGHLEQSFATEEEAKTRCELMISQGEQCDGITHHLVFGATPYGIWKQSGYAGGIGVYNTPKGYSSKVYNAEQCAIDTSNDEECPTVYDENECTHDAHCPSGKSCQLGKCIIYDLAECVDYCEKGSNYGTGWGSGTNESYDFNAKSESSCANACANSDNCCVWTFTRDDGLCRLRSEGCYNREGPGFSPYMITISDNSHVANAEHVISGAGNCNDWCAKLPSPNSYIIQYPDKVISINSVNAIEDNSATSQVIIDSPSDRPLDILQLPNLNLIVSYLGSRSLKLYDNEGQLIKTICTLPSPQNPGVIKLGRRKDGSPVIWVAAYTSVTGSWSSIRQYSLDGNFEKVIYEGSYGVITGDIVQPANNHFYFGAYADKGIVHLNADLEYVATYNPTGRVYGIVYVPNKNTLYYPNHSSLNEMSLTGNIIWTQATNTLGWPKLGPDGKTIFIIDYFPGKQDEARISRFDTISNTFLDNLLIGSLGVTYPGYFTFPALEKVLNIPTNSNNPIYLSDCVKSCLEPEVGASWGSGVGEVIINVSTPSACKDACSNDNNCCVYAFSTPNTCRLRSQGCTNREGSGSKPFMTTISDGSHISNLSTFTSGTPGCRCDEWCEQANVDICDPNPCQNGGTCTDNGDKSYTCDCTDTGFTGNNCDSKCWGCPKFGFAWPGSGTSYNSLNEAKAACEEIVANGGVCGGVTDYYGSEEIYYVYTESGYNQGLSNYLETWNQDYTAWEYNMNACNVDLDSCPSKIDPCNPNPCQNNGICDGTLGLSDYTCDCSNTDFNGNNCEISKPDPCDPNPCQNGGICSGNLGEGFKCDCSSTGFDGTTCSEACWGCPKFGFAWPGSGTSYNSLNEAKAACEEIVANGGVCGGVTDYYGSEEIYYVYTESGYNQGLSNYLETYNQDYTAWEYNMNACNVDLNSCPSKPDPCNPNPCGDNSCMIVDDSYECEIIVTTLVEPLEPECDEVAVHLQSDQTNEAAAILDSSPNNYPVTKYGHSRHETDNPYLGDSSFYFDGTNDYFNIGDPSSFKFLSDGTTDYTIDFHVYVNAFDTTDGLITTGGCSWFVGLNINILNDGRINALILRGTSGQFHRGAQAPIEYILN